MDYVHPWQPSSGEETSAESKDEKIDKELSVESIEKAETKERNECVERNEDLNVHLLDKKVVAVKDMQPSSGGESSGEKMEQNETKERNECVECNEEENEKEKIELSVENIEQCIEHNEHNKDSPDTSIVKVVDTKMISLKDMPTRHRGETRGQFMCRLALQFKNRDNLKIKTKDDVWISDTSTSSSGDDGDVSDVSPEDDSVM